MKKTSFSMKKMAKALCDKVDCSVDFEATGSEEWFLEMKALRGRLIRTEEGWWREKADYALTIKRVASLDLSPETHLKPDVQVRISFATRPRLLCNNGDGSLNTACIEKAERWAGKNKCKIIDREADIPPNPMTFARMDCPVTYSTPDMPDSIVKVMEIVDRLKPAVDDKLRKFVRAQRQWRKTLQ